MIERIKQAYKWRMFHLKYLIKSNVWELRYRTDFSEKSLVDNISVIVTGRNDNYGGDFSKRLMTTMDWNLQNLPQAELIYIEWNRISERPSDCEWISIRYPNVKCYIVPESIHMKICKNDKIKIMEYHAKNIGMRMASNDWFFLINADVFLGKKEFGRLQRLNTNTLYATNYVNINWDGEPIMQRHCSDKSIVSSVDSPTIFLDPVVGNFLFGHKLNFLRGTGYDERLNDVRSGVDSNGVFNMIKHGSKTMVLGCHYHLDHGESARYGYNPTHGNVNRLKGHPNVPYQNPPSWGFVDYPKKQIAENIWELQEI